MTDHVANENGLEIELTPIGSQSLVPGVSPISALDRLRWRTEAPLGPRKPQRPCDHGLFDLSARNQLELFGTRPTKGPT